MCRISILIGIPMITIPSWSRQHNILRGEFLKIGLEVKEDSFQWEGKSYKNIVAEKKGKTSPDRVFILGAHYDTVPGSPGADDNASAIAVLLEVARNIQTVPVRVYCKIDRLFSRRI